MTTYTSAPRILSRIAILVVAAFMAMAIAASPAYANNYKNATKYYGISKSQVTTVTKASKLESALKAAGKKATAKKKRAVYVKKSVTVKKTLTIPKNVVLIAESKVVFKATKSMDRMFNVAGSVYGGTYNGNNKANGIFLYGAMKYTKKNGRIQKATLKNTKAAGIATTSPQTKGVSILNCTITKCGKIGIAFMRGSASAVNNNKIYNNSYYGIMALNATIGNISGNTIYGHTGADEAAGVVLMGDDSTCTVKKFAKNKVYNNMAGVYVLEKAKITTYASTNNIHDNKLINLGIAEGGSVAGISGNAYVI